MMRKFLLLSIIAVSVSSISAFSSYAADDLPTAKQFARFFETVVFGAEYHEVTRESAIVKKWTTPIRVSISAMSGEMITKADGGRELKLTSVRPKNTHITSIQNHLNTMVKLTGIKTEDAKKVGEKPNYFIKFVPRLAMHIPSLVKGAPPNLLRKLAGPGVCYFLTAANKTGTITWATIVVNNQMSDKEINSCLLEEMIQSLGLPNDSNAVKPSLFNDTPLNTLTNNDLIVVATLYDDRLKVGMPRAAAVAKAKTIIADILQRLE
jgi:hypothetical protein